MSRPPSWGRAIVHLLVAPVSVFVVLPLVVVGFAAGIVFMGLVGGFSASMGALDWLADE